MLVTDNPIGDINISPILTIPIEINIHIGLLILFKKISGINMNRHPSPANPIPIENLIIDEK
ncbi:hypothetical protein AM1H77_04670 [Apilactobacillus micheneri]